MIYTLLERYAVAAKRFRRHVRATVGRSSDTAADADEDDGSRLLADSIETSASLTQRC